jgi:hypothetical protein
MKYDQFMYFSAFSAEQQDALKPFFSPDCESSIFKGVPVDRAEEFKRIARIIYPSCKVRVRFRGPREGGMRDYTLKRKARSVSIYVD